VLTDAIREMRLAVKADEEARRLRAEARADLTRAEAFAMQVEELVELNRCSVPETLVVDIRRFVRGHSRRLARAIGGEPRPAHVLDVLFDVQERIQQRMEEERVLSAA
jgi:hypothetical protein